MLFDLIHFERPYWLLAAPFTLLMAFFLRPHPSIKNTLSTIVDPTLLKYLEYKNTTNNNTNKWLGLIAMLLCWVGLAGISWTKVPTVMFESTQKTILIVDQSLSMYATDIKPNRQTQLKQTVRDILEQIKEGETALVAFAGEGFIISPFSQDRETITHFLQALEPIIMPMYGSNLSSGIETALTLHKDDDSPLHLIVFTDDLSTQDQQQIPKMLENLNVRLDLVAVGTEEASFIKLPDDRILKQNGKNIVPVTPINRLEDLTRSLGATFYHGRLSPVELAKITNTSLSNQQAEIAQNKSITWRDQGHWFAFPFLIWLAFQFRKGMVFMFFFALLNLPSKNLHASPLDWFLTQDQKGQQAVDQGNWQEAERLFTQPDWKAASSYALKNYATAIESLHGIDRNAAENYNLGNALALSGDTQKAIQAYQKALEQDPLLDVAKENLAFLEDQEREKEQKKQKEQEQSQKNKKQNSDKQQNNSDSDKKNDQEGSPESKKENKKNEKQDKKKTPEDNEQSQNQNTEHQSKKDSAKEKFDKENAQALNQWLRQIQDDPGLLLQRKLWYQHQEKRNENRFRQEDGLNPW